MVLISNGSSSSDATASRSRRRSCLVSAKIWDHDGWIKSCISSCFGSTTEPGYDQSCVTDEISDGTVG